MKANAPYFAAWLVAVALAFALAAAGPSDSSVMGRLPAFLSQALTRQPLALPDGLPAERTLALITFQRGQQAQIDSWIDGLNLRHDASIPWLQMAVRTDPGTPTGRMALETKMRNHFQGEAERARLVPVFADPAHFVRAAGLRSVHQMSAVVVNRQGEVLARVEGQFDETKARALRETLKASDF